MTEQHKLIENFHFIKRKTCTKMIMLRKEDPCLNDQVAILVGTDVTAQLKVTKARFSTVGLRHQPPEPLSEREPM